MAKRKILFHKGIDYAVLMLPDQTTDNPLASLYGEDRTVTKYGNLFAAAPTMLSALQRIADATEISAADIEIVLAAIAAAKGGA